MSVIALDLDGTLIDCRNRQVMLMRACGRALGVRFDADAFWERKREGRNGRDALLDVGVAQLQAEWMARHWGIQVENEYWLTYDQVFEDACGFLRQQRALGTRLVVLTARRRSDAVARQLARLGLRDLLNDVHVVSPQNAAAAKAELLERLNPAVFIGDTESDLEAARRAGALFVGVTGGQRSQAYLKASGAKAVAATLTEAQALIPA